MKSLHSRVIKKIIEANGWFLVSVEGDHWQFRHPITNNVLPDIDVLLPDGNTKEEAKMINETRKILGRKDIAVSILKTCPRNGYRKDTKPWK